MNDTPHPNPSPAPVPAPLAIWPCDPAPGEDELPQLVERVTPALLRRVLFEYSQTGDLVAVAGIDPAALLSAAKDADFDIAAVPATGPHAPITPPQPAHRAHAADSGEQTATVALIVAAIADPSRCAPDTWQRWQRRLRPGGVLVVVTACPAGAVRFANNAGIVVTAATAAGLSYQQHIVAIHARMANDQLLPPPGSGLPDTEAGVVQRPVHSDVLVFTNPARTTTEATR